MPWIVGIDEAGYGPNLGPFVMTAVACRVADNVASPDLWQVLRSVVRRAADDDDANLLLIDDSKVVHARGLGCLEANVLAALGRCEALTLAAFLDAHSAPSHAELRSEAWYTGETQLPVEADPTAYATLHQLLRATSAVTFAVPRAVVVCAERFNAITERDGSKGAVLADCLGELLSGVLAGDDGEPAAVFIDKHGGRNFYGPMLQQLLPDGLVLARQESNERSTYEVRGLAREVRVTFEPRADGTHMCVALASMVSKYIRELLMHEFNAFWQAQVPGLKPTAGYPGDARRFFKAILPAVKKMGIAERVLWRSK